MHLPFAPCDISRTCTSARSIQNILPFDFDIETKKYDLPQFLKADVVDASDVAGALAQVEPPYPGYKRTIQALHTYLQLAKESDGQPLPAVTKPIAPGDSYPGVPQLTSRLRLVGDLPADANVPPDGTIYQGPLVDAVKNFQRRLGREPDGRITTQTVADLNVPLTSRVRQMQLTLERWRWLAAGSSRRSDRGQHSRISPPRL